VGWLDLWRRWRLNRREKVVLARALIAVENTIRSFDGAPRTEATLRALDRELDLSLWSVYRRFYSDKDPGELYYCFPVLDKEGISVFLYLRGFPRGPIRKYHYEVATAPAN